MFPLRDENPTLLTPVVTIVGKTIPYQIEKVMGVSLEENLSMIADTVGFLVGDGCPDLATAAARGILGSIGGRGSGGQLPEAATFAANVMGTAHVLDAVRAAAGEVRSVIVVTSDKCYAPGPAPHPEGDPLGCATWP